MSAADRPSSPLALPTVDEARTIGGRLRPVDPRLLRQREGVRSRWWVCDERYIEVSVDEDDAGRPLFVEVAIRGRVARYRQGRGVGTSRTDELALEAEHRGAVPTSRLETADPARQDDVVAVAAALLGAAPDDDLRAFAPLFAGV